MPLALRLAILRRALKVGQHYKDRKKSDDTVFSIFHLAISPGLCSEGRAGLSQRHLKIAGTIYREIDRTLRQVRRNTTNDCSRLYSSRGLFGEDGWSGYNLGHPCVR